MYMCDSANAMHHKSMPSKSYSRKLQNKNIGKREEKEEGYTAMDMFVLSAAGNQRPRQCGVCCVC